jgi:phosphonatase-like hydrolase
MSIRLAVFDMAGTTVADQYAVANAFREAFRMNNIEIDKEEVQPLMGYKKIAAIETVLEQKRISFDRELADRIHEDFVNMMVGFYEASPDVKPITGAEDVFLLLKERGIRVALNTGFPRNIADAIINRFQWKEKGLIDDYIASDEVETGRPQPFMIQELMRRAGVHDAEEVAKVGDTAVDIEEGRNAGCSVIIAVTTGAYTKNDLLRHKPDYIFDDLNEVAAIIK